MIYLVLAILSSASISILMRISEKYIKNEMTMFMTNYGVCMMMSALFMKDMTQLGGIMSPAGTVALSGVTVTLVTLGSVGTQRSAFENGDVENVFH